MRNLDGYQDLSTMQLFPTDGGIDVVFGVTVTASSPSDETALNALIATNINPNGNLGNSPLSLQGPLGMLIFHPYISCPILLKLKDTAPDDCAIALTYP